MEGVEELTMMTTILTLALLQAAPTDAKTEIEQLCVDLGSDDPEVRDQATKTLLTSGRAAIRPVMALKKSGDAEVRGRADAIAAQLIATLRDSALKLEVKLIDEKVKPGESVRFQATLKNVDEFPVDIVIGYEAAEGQVYYQSEKQVQRQVQQQERNNDLDVQETVAKTVTLKPGESVDVSSSVQVTFRAGRASYATLAEAAGHGPVTMTVQFAEGTMAASEDALRNLAVNRVNVRNVAQQRGQQVAQQTVNSYGNHRVAAPKAKVWAAEAKVEIEQ